MFGGVGVGKSSFLNTVATALKNDPNSVCKAYATAPSRTGTSKTSTVGNITLHFIIAIDKSSCLDSGGDAIK